MPDSDALFLVHPGAVWTHFLGCLLMICLGFSVVFAEVDGQRINEMYDRRAGPMWCVRAVRWCDKLLCGHVPVNPLRLIAGP